MARPNRPYHAFESGIGLMSDQPQTPRDANDTDWLQRLLEAESVDAAPSDFEADQLMALAELAEAEDLDEASVAALGADPEALELVMAGREAPSLGPLPLRLIARARALVERQTEGRVAEPGEFKVFPVNIFGGLRPVGLAAGVAMLLAAGFQAGRLGTEAALVMADDGALARDSLLADTRLADAKLLDDPLSMTLEDFL